MRVLHFAILGCIGISLIGLIEPVRAKAQKPLQPFRLRVVRKSVPPSSLTIDRCIEGRIYEVQSFDIPFVTRNDPGVLSDSIEMPWLNNQREISAIPPGRYKAHIRTDGSLGWRIELEGTEPRRTNIEIHAGTKGVTTTMNTAGCILVGKRTNQDPCWLEQSRAYRDAIQAAYNDASNKRPIEVEVLEK